MTERKDTHGDPPAGAPHGAPDGESLEQHAGETPSASPYRNLFVPLVLVPAAIVATILFVFVMFSAITGKETSLEQNLDRVLSGGKNERKQAMFNLVQQLEENRLALLAPDRDESAPLPWPVEPAFLAGLRRAWTTLPAEDVEERQVVATALAQLDPAEGPEKLLELLALEDRLDPDGAVRFSSALNLAALGGEGVRPALIGLLENADPGLRSVAAIALQRFPASETGDALSRRLDDEDFVVRANAALSLASLGDPRSAPLLRTLVLHEPYALERERDKARFHREREISAARVKAVEALGGLELAEDAALLREISREEEDLDVREAALRALARREP